MQKIDKPGQTEYHYLTLTDQSNTRETLEKMLNRSFRVFLCVLFVHSQTKDNLINSCNDDLSRFRTGDDMMTDQFVAATSRDRGRTWFMITSMQVICMRRCVIQWKRRQMSSWIVKVRMNEYNYLYMILISST